MKIWPNDPIIIVMKIWPNDPCLNSKKESGFEKKHENKNISWGSHLYFVPNNM
jgi:hypothetical protein